MSQETDEPSKKTGRILVDTERERHALSGLGYYCSNLRHGLSDIRDADVRIDYYGVEQYRPWHALFNPSARGYDVVHITHQQQRYMTRLTGNHAKVIVTLHDLNFLYEKLSPLQRKRRLSLVGRLLNKADMIVCISHFVRKDLERNLHLFRLKPSVQIEVVYNGIVFVPALEHYVPNISLPKPYILSIGVLQEKKQQHLLVEALHHLPEDLHLILVYSGAKAEYQALITRLIEEHRLKHRVHLFRSISEQDKAHFLSNCMCYAHPSIAEGFGIPPIEAMAMGKPVFLSHATSLPEVGGAEAYYLDSNAPLDIAETIMRGLNEFSHDINKPQRLQQWAAQYDYRQMARQYLELYKSLL